MLVFSTIVFLWMCQNRLRRHGKGKEQQQSQDNLGSTYKVWLYHVSFTPLLKRRFIVTRYHSFHTHRAFAQFKKRSQHPVLRTLSLNCLYDRKGSKLT
jgi:hypothetical protein